MPHYTAGPLISETGPKYSINAGNGGASTRHIAMVSLAFNNMKETAEKILLMLI